MICPVCDVNNPIRSWSDGRGDEELICPSCGSVVDVGGKDIVVVVRK